MKCPFCAFINNKVIDSRVTKGGEAIRRRRECLECGRRFTTHEQIEHSILVIKKDDQREPFHRDKILRGIRRACEKRPIGAATLEKVVDRIEARIFELNEKEIDSSIIGEEVMVELRELDQIAYVRFASVYRSFQDVSEFQEMLRALLEGTARQS